MSCTVLLELKVKPGTGDEVLATLKSILPDTRSYDGHIGMYVIRNQDDPDVLVAVEEWESKAHHEKYLAWRTETGVMDTLMEVVAEPPSIRYFDPTDA